MADNSRFELSDLITACILLKSNIENALNEAKKITENARELRGIVDTIQQNAPDCLRVEYRTEKMEEMHEHINNCAHFVKDLRVVYMDDTLKELHARKKEALAITQKLREMQQQQQNYSIAQKNDDDDDDDDATPLSSRSPSLRKSPSQQ